MAVSPISPSKPTTTPKNNKQKKKERKPDPPCSSPAKRNTAPGVRLIGRRIYDSENGKSCHQCRQKTMDFVAACKNQGDCKPCTIKFCHKCLFNRYGEKAEEVSLLGDWKCPKCRGICNCSFCMKKRGHQPTGILVHTAKATGFLSVSEMLHASGAGNIAASPKKPTFSKDLVVASPKTRKLGKGKMSAGKIDSNLQPKLLTSDTDEKKIVNGKRKELGQESSNENVCENIDNAIDKSKLTTKFCKLKHGMRIHNTEFDAHIQLPPGIDLTTVAGIDLPAEDIGHALQFLEFCNAFGQVFNLKKGQPEAVLRELKRGCRRHQRKHSSIIRFHTQLLSFIQKEAGEESPLSSTSNRSSWLQALGKCILESQCAPRELPSDLFDSAGDGYDKLDPSKKLRLLNFLCDETLCTVDLRAWIDEQKNSKFVEREKAAKEKVLAAKDMERRLKQKMWNEVAKDVLLKHGTPLSISEHEDIVSKIKIEAAKSCEETLEAIDMVPKKKQMSDAIRTEPVLLDGNGQVFWRLKGYSAEPNIFLQDIGSWDSVRTEDKWFTYDVEQKKMLENYIFSLRYQ